MADEKKDSIPFINNGVPATITKTPIPAKKTGKEGRGKALRQVMASFVANLGTVNTGMAFGFSATSIPQLQGKDSYIPITDDQASWIASLSAAGTPIGCILSGYLMDNIGRRRTLIITEIPLIFGWLMVAFAQNVPMLYIGRLMIGFGSGMVGAPARVYTCEVSQPHLRGMLGALASVGVSTGVLIQYVIGSVTSWNILAGISATIPILSLLGMLFLPETPNYLLQQDRRERAESSLAKLRGSTCNLDDEIQKMIAFKEKNHVDPSDSECEYFQQAPIPDQKMKPGRKPPADNRKRKSHTSTTNLIRTRLHGPREIIKALLLPSTLKPFMILAIYFFVYQWCGVNIITFYAIQVFEVSGAPVKNKYWLTISMGIVRVIFTVIGCILCRKCGRRMLTFVSGFGCGITMIILAVYMYYVKFWHDNNLPTQHTWIPVASIFIFVISCTLGYLIIPWVMIGEVYPTQVRGIVGGMTTCVAHLSVFSVVKSYDFLKNQLNQYGVFGLYGTMSLFALIFFYFFLPETKGKTLQEIEDYFSGRTKSLTRRNTQCEGA